MSIQKKEGSKHENNRAYCEGMSWESTTEYYRIINDILVRQGGCPVPLFDAMATDTKTTVE